MCWSASARGEEPLSDKPLCFDFSFFLMSFRERSVDEKGGKRLGLIDVASAVEGDE